MRDCRAAHELIEYIIDYVENVRDRPVLPSVEPGYLKPLLPDKAPYLREPWAKIMPDIERFIMPGVSVLSRGGHGLRLLLCRSNRRLALLVGLARSTSLGRCRWRPVRCGPLLHNKPQTRAGPLAFGVSYFLVLASCHRGSSNSSVSRWKERPREILAI